MDSECSGDGDWPCVHMLVPHLLHETTHTSMPYLTHGVLGMPVGKLHSVDSLVGDARSTSGNMEVQYKHAIQYSTGDSPVVPQRTTSVDAADGVSMANLLLMSSILTTAKQVWALLKGRLCSCSTYIYIWAAYQQARFCVLCACCKRIGVYHRFYTRTHDRDVLGICCLYTAACVGL